MVDLPERDAQIRSTRWDFWQAIPSRSRKKRDTRPPGAGAEATKSLSSKGEWQVSGVSNSSLLFAKLAASIPLPPIRFNNVTEYVLSLDFKRHHGVFIAYFMQAALQKCPAAIGTLPPLKVVPNVTVYAHGPSTANQELIIVNWGALKFLLSMF